ncbi:MAG TPA: hypothetical protein VHX20_17620 [Terracidiphilus sp.]|nr:hypothetical protein [Terracidiphilus sp.]
MERRDPAQGKVLGSWIQNRVLPVFAGRILAVDIPIALRCATLHVPNPCSDRDALIAATALVHSMTVITQCCRLRDKRRAHSQSLARLNSCCISSVH